MSSFLQLNATDQSTSHAAVIISGGSAGNAVLDAFTSLFDVCHFVLPVSDNGGSSSEIIRVLGGPSLGDIRSRLIRLIPDTPDRAGIKALFAYRLPSHGSSQAIKGEWLEIVEGSHRLWRDIPPDRREAIRAFLVHFEHAILRRAQRRFNFRSGSVGNFWLAGAQLFVRSLQSAIFLFSSVCGLSSTQHTVLPCINTNSLVTIAAELQDGSRIVGQNEISHPSESSSAMPYSANEQRRAIPESFTPVSNASFLHPYDGTQHTSRAMSVELDYDDTENVIARSQDDLQAFDDDETTESMEEIDYLGQADGEQEMRYRRESESARLVVSKAEDDGYTSLPSPISRIFYLNTYGQETFPAPSSAFLSSLAKSETLIYSCGSLYTSLVPPLALIGTGNAIALSPSLKRKVLLLNSSFDRESDGLTAVDFVMAITHHLNFSIRGHLDGHARTPTQFVPSDYVTHLIYPTQGTIPVDIERLQDLNINVVPMQGRRFDDMNLRDALSSILR